MRPIPLVLALVVALGGAAVPVRAQGMLPDSTRVLNLSFATDGTVTLSAKNVTIREILAEWARQCGCYVVNGDKLGGAPLSVPLLYEHQTQAKVLESLLRQAAGYVLTPQRTGVISKSNFETIYILATSNPVATSYTPPTAAAPAYPMPTMGSPDDEIPPVLPSGPPGSESPRPLGPPPGAGGPPAPTPGSTSGAPTPRPGGMPSTFVPIIPVGTPQSSAPPPGSVAPAAPPTPGR